MARLNLPSYSEVPDGLTPEAQRARARFYRKYEAFVDKARRVALTVLVWGPAPDSPNQLSRKRRQIRDELKQRGHFAVFSEDIVAHTSEVPLKFLEYAQAQAADLIILLVGDTLGATGELHDFANHRKLVHKVFAMYPKRLQGSYAALGVIKILDGGFRRVYWYEDEELERCNVVSQAVECAEMLRYLSALS